MTRAGTTHERSERGSPLWRTPLGAILTAFAAVGIVLLLVCVTMFEHLHFWLVLPYVLLAAFPTIALVVYALQAQREGDRVRHLGRGRTEG